ncbi:MAG: hypothetical protein KKD21_02880 [Proteobacteria bacterium]|nr:hypothetical protein [Pseudomonadota bacterium]MBU1695973.1 hypothetical protein [Pseudomonadota bacterium]
MEKPLFPHLQMWQSLWPGIPEDKVPIDYVTKGVHVPTLQMIQANDSCRI